MATDGGGAALSHQVVRLEPGRHSSPEKGACVVELASVLGGDPFSDHPRSVCPVVAAFMRTVNDGVTDRERQRLYPYAAAIVGTRCSVRTRRQRARLCLSWARAMGVGAGPLSRVFGGWASGGKAALLCAKAALRHGGPSLALTLADALIELDGGFEQRIRPGDRETSQGSPETEPAIPSVI